MRRIYKIFIFLCCLYLFNTALIFPFSNVNEVFAFSKTYLPQMSTSTVNLTGPNVYLQDTINPAADSTWLTAVDGTTSTSVDVTIQNPNTPLQTGANLQTVKALVRKNATGGNNPAATLIVYENNSGVRTQIATTSLVIPDAPTVISVSFDSNSLVDKTGNNLEVKVTGAPGTGSTSTKRTVEIGSINFVANLTMAPFGAPPSFEASRISSTYTDLSWEAVSTATNYEVKRDGVVIYTGTNTNFTDSGLSQKTSYTYEVRAYNGSSYSSSSLLNITTPNSSDWLEVEAGDSVSYGLKANGTLWTWGTSNIGQLGLGITTRAKIPTQIGTDTNWKSISTYYEHVLALKSDGTLWGWGYNSSHELGLGDTTDRATPTQIGADSDWASVSAGGNFSLAIKKDGTLWGWGHNSEYQLGLGDTTERNVPTKIGTATDWKMVSSGYNSALAIKTNGTLWGWSGNQGELGLGDYVTRTVPTKIGSSVDWKKVVVGNNHSLAIKTDGTLWSSGSNSYGQLGLGDTTQRNVFTQIGTATDWKNIAAGFDHSFAIKTTNTLWAWGYNWYGQLGLNDKTQRLVPTQVGTDSNWLSIATEQLHSLGTKTDGTLWSFGYNISYELGLNDTAQRLIPTKVVSPDTTPPSNVSNLNETHSDITVSLTWTNPSDSDFNRANVYRNGVLIGNSTNGTYNDSGLSPSTTYTYKITSLDSSGNESTGVSLLITTDAPFVKEKGLIEGVAPDFFEDPRLTDGDINSYYTAISYDNFEWTIPASTINKIYYKGDKIMEISFMLCDNSYSCVTINSTTIPSNGYYTLPAPLVDIEHVFFNVDDIGSSTADVYEFDVYGSSSSSGNLSMTSPTISSFGNAQINYPSKTVYSSLDSFVVSDTRSSSDGWHVSVSASQFIETAPVGGFISGYSPILLPIGSLKLNAPTALPLNGSSLSNLSINGSSWNIDDGNSHTIVTKSSNSGEYQFDFPSKSLELSLQSSYKMIDTIHYPTNPTPYESTVTWNLISGP